MGIKDILLEVLIILSFYGIIYGKGEYYERI